MSLIMSPTRFRSPVRRVAVIGAVALIAAGCGGGSNTAATSPTAHTKADPAQCGLDAFEKATSPVNVTFWHVQAEADATNLQALADEFNGSQSKVRVKLVQQQDYPGEMQKWQAGLTTGDLPDVAQMEDTTVQRLVDGQSTIPVADCVEADNFDLSDFSKRSLAFYTDAGLLQSMAWSVSNVALFYNKIDFRKAGLDPDHPPTTLDEVERAAKQIVDSRVDPHGISLKVAPYFFEFWGAKAGQTLVNNGNGRKARTTKATIDTPTGLSIWTWWKRMVDSGLAINIGTDPTTIDHFIALANHQAAMTIESNANLARINEALASGTWKDLEIGLAPLPGLRATGAVPIGDGSLWISKKSSLAKRGAAWQWIKFLVSKKAQVTWHTEKGSVPTRISVSTDPTVKALWAQHPEFAVGWDQLQQGPLDDSTSGSLIGPYQEVRDAITNGIVAMLDGKATAAQALSKTQTEADVAITDYNERVGG